MNVLRTPTYADVARHLDIVTTERIRLSRELPAEWKGSAKLTTAHCLYWEERDRESGIACALAEEPLAQHPSPVCEAHIMPSNVSGADFPV